jgi:hypothetical protein
VTLIGYVMQNVAYLAYIIDISTVQPQYSDSNVLGITIIMPITKFVPIQTDDVLAITIYR